MMRQHMIAMVIGFLLDCCLGDPHWLPHPIRGIGWLISRLEAGLRRWFPKTEKGERAGGTILVLAVLLVTALLSCGILWLAGMLHPLFGLAVECILCYQMLAARDLRNESMKVWQALDREDVEGARKAVSMIVGRDTQSLSREGMIKAAVETVAENTSDGVVAPLIYMAIGGGPLAVLYKAVNTMDSMIGYQNETYLHFGRAAAKLDDVLNFLPSRISAACMIGAAYLLRMDGAGAARIYARDRRNHKSPNSAQTEAVCAGALDVQLAGDAYYFGVLCKKPTIGDDIRPVEADDIKRANGLMYMTAILAAVFFAAVLSALILWR